MTCAVSLVRAAAGGQGGDVAFLGVDKGVRRLGGRLFGRLHGAPHQGESVRIASEGQILYVPGGAHHLVLQAFEVGQDRRIGRLQNGYEVVGLGGELAGPRAGRLIQRLLFGRIVGEDHLQGVALDGAAEAANLAGQNHLPVRQAGAAIGRGDLSAETHGDDHGQDQSAAQKHDRRQQFPS